MENTMAVVMSATQLATNNHWRSRADRLGPPGGSICVLTNSSCLSHSSALTSPRELQRGTAPNPRPSRLYNGSHHSRNRALPAQYPEETATVRMGECVWPPQPTLRPCPPRFSRDAR